MSGPVPAIPVGRARLVVAPLLVGLLAGPALATPDPTDIERRVEAIVSGLSLAGKIGQLNLVPNSPDFSRDAVAAGQVGGVLAFTNGRDVAAVQAVARRSRPGVPLLVGLDVLHGLRTMFPVPLGEAASFDPALAREAARIAAGEARRIGINWTFAPMADLARDPRWGRIVEGFGEDPLVGRLFTRARVEGFRAGGLGVTLKHFAGYGAAIGGRDYDAAAIAGSDLHENYLPPFRAGIEAGAESVMSAFHTLNGVPASADRGLLTGLLRERWRYDGFVVSDWMAIPQLIEHGVAADGAEAARKALRAGVDMDMAGGLYARHLSVEIAAGRVSEADVTEAARRVVRAKLRMGLFEPTPEPEGDGSAAPPRPEAREAARRIARGTIVLLRNEGALPIRPGARIALVGGMAESGKDLIGPHGALVKWEDATSLRDALGRRAEAGGGSVTFAEGCDAGCGASDGFEAAVAAARAADTVVAVLGEPLDLTGEAASRAHLTLPGRQADLLRRLVETDRPVVLVLLASRPVELGPVVDRLAGLLMAFYPGTEGGGALADLLFGDSDPSAKLPVSWPRTIGQVPLPYDRRPTGRPNDPANRYTLRYVDEELSPLYPFGFGLTYTGFALTDARIETPRVAPGGTVSVSATLTNTGARAGREVVQLYLHQRVAAVSRPARKLHAFTKVALAAGESRRVVLTVPAAELAYPTADGLPVLEPGPFEVFLGTDSRAPSAGRFDLVP